MLARRKSLSRRLLSNLPRNLIWLFVVIVTASRIMGAHGHACSDGKPDCLNEIHAHAVVHASESCADESCIDITIEAADGSLARVLDLDDGQFLAILPITLPGLILPRQKLPEVRRTHGIKIIPARRFLPPARAPPLTL